MLSFTLVGCANLMTIDRSTSLPLDGEVVHLDAPQRVVISNRKGLVCAEPSPDALQAYAASVGASFSTPSKEFAAALAASLAGSSGSIGLRTQSITLMRDHLFRICEAYYNGKVDKDQTVQLIQRSQDLTLAILAIEQLTGAVVARQVVLGGSTSAEITANVSNTQAALDRAVALEELKREAFEKAKAEVGTRAKALEETDASMKAAKDKKDANGKPAPDNEELKKLTPQREQQATDLADAKTALALAESSYANAKKSKEVIEANFNRAIADAKTNATAGGELGGNVGRTNISSETASVIASATTDIVDRVVNKTYLTNFCILFMAKEISNMTKKDELAMKRCDQLIASVIKSQEKYQELQTQWLQSVQSKTTAPATPAGRPRVPQVQ